MQIAAFAFEPLLPETHDMGDFGKSDTLSHVSSTAVAEVLPPPASTFSEEELEAAKSAAYEEGFMAGKAEGKREIDHEALQLQHEAHQVAMVIQQHLDSLGQQHQQYLISKQSDLGRLVLGCAERLAVEALRKEPLADIEAMVRDCLGLMMGKPEVTVQVHPKLQQALTKKFGSALIKIVGVPEMNPVDCHIAWSYGEAHREIDKIWHQIEETIDRYFAISATEMMQQITTPSIESLPPEGEDHHE